jgi:hypothetical protein
VLLSGGDAGEGQGLEQRVLRGDEGHVAGKGWWHRGSGQAFGNASPVGGVGALRAARRPVVRTLRLRHRGQPCRALAQAVGTAASESTRRAPRRGRARGVWAPAAAEPEGHLVGSDPRVVGVATVQSLPRAGMPPDQGNALVGPAVGPPGPGQPPRDGHAEPLAGRGEGREPGGRRSLQVAGQQDFASVRHDPDVPAPRVQIKATVQGGWVGGASPEVFSSVVSDFFPRSAYHRGMVRRRPQSLSTACT